MAKKYYVHHQYKPRGRRTKLIIIGLIIILLLALATAAVRRVFYESLKPVGTSSTSKEVVIPRGADVDKITDVLVQAQLIRSAWAFKLYIHNQNAGNVLQAGTYQLRPNMTVNEIVAVLSHGKVVTNLLTILPGQSIAQVKQTFLKAGFSQAEVDEAFDPNSYPDAPILVDKPATASLEGFLFPDSYQKDSATSARSIVMESMSEMQQHLTTNIRNAYAAQGLSTYQGLILASIIEKEVSRPTDKAQVAQVFLTRLHQNISLGSDPTAFYGAVLAGKAPSVLYDSPYNTLQHTGLPPTPISSVSQSSLDALANPAGTDWLFFVAGDDGVTHFSHTLAEHDALAKQYCHTLCQ